MKKIIVTIFIGLSSLVALSKNPYPNDSVQPIAFKNSFSSVIKNLIVENASPFTGNEIPDTKNFNLRAVKDFQERFRDVSNILWFSEGNGYISCFLKNGYWDRAFYDKKGHWQYSLIFYGEDELPQDIRTAVKSVYFDWSIKLVEEVKTNQGMAYIIHLENRVNIKILKVMDDGEIVKMNEFVKA